MRAVKPRLKEMLTFIMEYRTDQLSNIIDDARYEHLRRILQA